MKRYTTYVNGKIYTDLRHSNKVECLVTDLKKVVFAGDLAKARREFDAQEFDLHGHTLYPAFQDAHGHLTDLGRSLSYPDLNACKSEDEMLLVMKNNASSFDSKQWMIGRGWDQNKWNIKELPDNTKLNALFPDIPVMLVRTDSHAALLNQTALNLSEHAWKPYSDSAHVLKNEKGMSGLLMDEAYYSVLPISAESIQVKRKLISTASDFLISKGITSIGDAWWTAEDRQLFLNLNDDQDLKIRIYGMMLPEEDNKHYFENTGIVKKGLLHLRAFKFFADGALGSRGAALLDDYSDSSGNKGFILHDSKYWNNQAEWCSHYGAQMVTHAIGDAANRMILGIYAQHLQSAKYKRWRIEHAQMVHNLDIEFFKTYQIIPVIQACHAVSDYPWVESRVGKERSHTLYRYKDFVNLCDAVPNTTDFPIEPPDVIANLYAAIYRQNTNGMPENGYNIDQAVSPQTALKSVTLDASYAQYEESEFGQLNVGSQAEIVVLDKDLLHVPKDEFLSTKVVYVRRSESVLLE